MLRSPNDFLFHSVGRRVLQALLRANAETRLGRGKMETCVLIICLSAVSNNGNMRIDQLFVGGVENGNMPTNHFFVVGVSGESLHWVSVLAAGLAVLRSQMIFFFTP